MKILFTTRASLFSQPGGDTQQVMQTAEALRNLGVTVDIKLRGEQIDFNAYDLVHFFNIGRPADLIGKLENISVPLVISSIWVDYSEYDSISRPKLFKIFGSFGLEYLKTIGRSYNASDKFPGLQYLLLGQKRSMKKLLKKASLVLTTSSSESNRIAQTFGVHDKVEVLQLGLPEAFHQYEKAEKRTGALCVGRIEESKNQLNLIIAAKNAKWPLTIVGKPAINQPGYNRQCHLAADKNVSFAGWYDTPNLIEAYRTAQVLVLPSYFETYGLVVLEALSQGCNLALAYRPDMNQIFAGKAEFFDPNDPADIRNKIDLALRKPPYQISPEELHQAKWPIIATHLLGMYAKILT